MVKDEGFFQVNLFTDTTKLEKEKRLQNAMLGLKKKFGKNAVLKGQKITIKYFTDGYYEDIAGVLDAVDAINKELQIYTGFINDTGKELPTIIAFEDILEIGMNMT